MNYVVIFFQILVITLAYSQSPQKPIKITCDSSRVKSDLYLTKYWYDEYFIYNPHELEYFPLWICYVETDSTLNQTIVAKNIGFDIIDTISISNSFIVNSNDSLYQLKSPIIENFLYNPVCIWSQYSDSIVNVQYSVLVDSIWSSPQTIVVHDTTKINYLYYSSDRTNSQEINFFIWSSGNSLYKASLNSAFLFEAYSLLYDAENDIVSFDLQNDASGDLWLIVEEKISIDSVGIKLLIFDQNVLEWEEPVALVKLPKEISDLDINFIIEDECILSWIRKYSFHDSLIKNFYDSIWIEPSYVEIPGNILDITSNTLLNGGCCVFPFPYFFISYEKDSMNYLKQFPLDLYEYYPFHATTNELSDLTISGLNNLNYAFAWIEDSEIFISFERVYVGDLNDDHSYLPQTVHLTQNSPNPFNAMSRFSYFLPSSQQIEITLFDVVGRKVKSLFSGNQIPGDHTIILNGNELASGLYFYCLKTEKYILMKKFILIK